MSDSNEIIIQADWNQEDTEAVDYIKNKPTNLSQFNNDCDFITIDEINDKVAILNSMIDDINGEII